MFLPSAWKAKKNLFFSIFLGHFTFACFLTSADVYMYYFQKIQNLEKIKEIQNIQRIQNFRKIKIFQKIKTFQKIQIYF